MAKANRQDRSTRGPKSNRGRPIQLPSDDLLHVRPRGRGTRKPLEAQTDAQAAYINAIDVYDLVFARGPAGTGKTYIAAAKAAEWLEAAQPGERRRLILTRPAVGAEEEYGFLPGELEEKIAPWAAPLIAVLEERMGAGKVEYMLQAKQIEIAPLGMLRGHTFNDAFVILDEAQNTTPNQMKLFMTRFGKNAKMVIDGDPFDQKDIKGLDGFTDAWRIMDGHPSVGFVEFDIDDIVRSGLCRDILIRYSQRNSTVGHAELRTTLDRSVGTEPARH